MQKENKKRLAQAKRDEAKKDPEMQESMELPPKPDKKQTAKGCKQTVAKKRPSTDPNYTITSSEGTPVSSSKKPLPAPPTGMKMVPVPLGVSEAALAAAIQAAAQAATVNVNGLTVTAPAGGKPSSKCKVAKSEDEGSQDEEASDQNEEDAAPAMKRRKPIRQKPAASSATISASDT